MIRKKQIFKAFTLPVFLLIIEREVSKERTKDMKQRKHRYQFPDGFLWEVPHLGLKAKERFLEMAKDLATGITGLVLSQLSFITKLVQKNLNLL